MSFLLSTVKWLALALIGGTGGLGLLLYTVQTKLIYPANVPSGSRSVVDTPAKFGMSDFSEVTLTTPDNVRIKAFLILQPDNIAAKRPTVLLLHANAGNVGHRLPLAKVFHKNMRCNVLALSYRGYGHSEGVANEKGIKLDSQTALDFILSHPTLEKTPIWLYGQSIGGAVAIHLASQNPTRVNGLIVENTFLSLPKLVPAVMPAIAAFVPYLLHQIWPSERYMASLPASFPVLFLAGAQDKLVVPPHMVELHKLCPSTKKEWNLFEYGTHNDTCAQPGYFVAIAEYIKAHTPGLEPVPTSGDEEKEKNKEEEDAVEVLASGTDGDDELDVVGDAASSIGGDSFELVEREAELLAATDKL